LAWVPTARKGRTKTFGPWNPLTVTLQDVENRTCGRRKLSPARRHDTTMSAIRNDRGSNTCDGAKS
jgi:hypothetical protein